MAAPSSKSIANAARDRSKIPGKPTHTSVQPTTHVTSRSASPTREHHTLGGPGSHWNLKGLGTLINLKTGASQPPGGGTKSPPAGPSKPTGPSILPFLDPTQQAALTTFDTNQNAAGITNAQKFNDAIGRTNLALANAQQTRDVATDNTNQAMAARGLFQSSIRDGALNDIDTTLTTRQNTLNAALGSTALGVWNEGARLATNSATQHTLYDQLAITNAQAITPTTAAPGSPAPPSTTPPPAPSTAPLPRPPGESHLAAPPTRGGAYFPGGPPSVPSAPATVDPLSGKAPR